MKNKLIWRIMLAVGIAPFVFPFLNFVYEMMISSSWTFAEWMILYSFVYWPTYIVGAIIIGISIYKLKK